ncbi:25S rRNA (adenine645-N1)-methyltransferase [Polyrhizophydium stewartii]|uniref:Ribosomal RNA-processing protein 8 n=1 Tax=Polyrhizophydium stewartii TaxID=2732419 RepID=A0ABR4N9L6_9FUNG
MQPAPAAQQQQPRTGAHTRHAAADALLGGAIRFLESCPGVADVRVAMRPPCSPSLVAVWERSHGRQLPADLADFLLVADGICVAWGVDFGDGYERMQLGTMHIEPLERIVPVVVTDGVGAPDPPADAADAAEGRPPGPAFVIADCTPTGTVCLCFPREPSASQQLVWFHNAADSTWTPIAATFSCYFRLMVSHLGIDGWQLGLTRSGLPRHAADWLCFFAPERAAWVRQMHARRVRAQMPIADVPRAIALDPLGAGRARLAQLGLAAPRACGQTTADTSQQRSKLGTQPASPAFSIDRVLKLVQIVAKDGGRAQSASAPPAPSGSPATPQPPAQALSKAAEAKKAAAADDKPKPTTVPKPAAAKPAAATAKKPAAPGPTPAQAPLHGTRRPGGVGKKAAAPRRPAAQPSEAVAGSLSEMQAKMQRKLAGAKFRWINERLYTTSSADAVQMFSQQPELFEIYHSGFSSQVEDWPTNPVDVFLADLSKKPPGTVIADMGCGEAKIAQMLHGSMTVHSFDLVAGNDFITACDIAHVPLAASSCDVVVFCLSLMGTNFVDFLKEARRILKSGGELKIAEVVSRISDMDQFDTSNKMFVVAEFTKTGKPRGDAAAEALSLKPCIYKRR